MAQRKQSDCLKSMRFFHFIGRNHVVHLSSCSFKLLLSYFTHRKSNSSDEDQRIWVDLQSPCWVLSTFLGLLRRTAHDAHALLMSHLPFIYKAPGCLLKLIEMQQVNQDIHLEVSSGSASYLAWRRQSAAQPALISKHPFQTEGLWRTATTIAPHVHQRFFHDTRRQKTILRHLLVWGMAGRM